MPVAGVVLDLRNNPGGLATSVVDVASQFLSEGLVLFQIDTVLAEKLSKTYETLRDLHLAGRNHIWGFVARNLARPVWLSQEDQMADVVIGNPPWLSYRNMELGTQGRFREECQRRGLWTGGKVANRQDLSSFFFVRCLELYLKPTGVIAFVMPYAAMSRRQFEGFRTGVYGARQGKRVQRVLATAQFTESWVLRDDVQPLFPVPSCVLIARHGGGEGRILPATVLAATGMLPQRDSSPAEAEAELTWSERPWPTISDEEEGPVSSYRAQFHQGPPPSGFPLF